MSEIAERVNACIERKNITKMAALAHDLDVNESAISRWRHGSVMSMNNCVRFCLLLDVSMDWLVLGRGHMDMHQDFIVSGAEREIVESLRKIPNELTVDLCSLIATLCRHVGGRMIA